MTHWLAQLLDDPGDSEDEWLGGLEREFEELVESLDAELLGDEEAR